jgi:hypothetical protein
LANRACSAGDGGAALPAPAEAADAVDAGSGVLTSKPDIIGAEDDDDDGCVDDMPDADDEMEEEALVLALVAFAVAGAAGVAPAFALVPGNPVPFGSRVSIISWHLGH